MSMSDYSLTYKPTTWECCEEADNDSFESRPTESVHLTKWPNYSSAFGDDQTTVVFENDVRSVSISEVKIVDEERLVSEIGLYCLEYILTVKNKKSGRTYSVEMKINNDLSDFSLGNN